MSRALPAAVLLSAALLAPAPASAQDSGQPDGFWLSAGLGPAVSESAGWGVTGYVRMGTTLGPRLRLGGQALLYERVQYTSKVRSNLTLSLLARPLRDSGLFLKGGLGLATEEEAFFDRDAGRTRETTEIRPGANLGIGHELRLGGGNLFLTPNFDVALGLFDDGFLDPDAVFVLTLGLGFR